MNPRRLHLAQQHTDRHRRRRIKQRAHQPPEIEGLHRGTKPIDQGEVLEVNQAKRLVERVGVDRQPRNGACTESLDDLIERCILGDCHDLATRDAHILDSHAPQSAQVGLQTVGRTSPRHAGLRISGLGLCRNITTEESGKERDLSRTVGILAILGLRSRNCLPVGYFRHHSCPVTAPLGRSSGEYGFAIPRLASIFVSRLSITSASASSSWSCPSRCRTP